MKFLKTSVYCICLSMFSLANAQIERDFEERASFNTNGNITLIGNTLMTCESSSNCTDTQNGIINTNNNSFNMVNVNIDTAAALNNSSSADLTMPVGSTVLFAGLYWGARADENDTNRASIKIKAPGQTTYTQVSADNIDTIPDVNNAATRPYQAVADVTDIVLASGNGTYFVGDIVAVTGQSNGGFYGGWSLAIIFQDNAQPFRRLMLFDGAANVANTNTVSVDVTGLLTPVSGSFETFVGALSWEGDAGINGDALTFEGDVIDQNINSANNFWNGSISNLDTHVTNKNPNYVNQLTMDIDMIDVSSSLSNNATTANIEFSTGGDGYYPHYLAFVTELFLPDFDSNMSKTAEDLNGGVIGLGDEIEYTISFDNSGKDGATNTVLTDPIPANTTYVADSLEVVNASIGPIGVQTDDIDGDIAEYDAANNQVVFRLGDGADQNNGGTFLENQGATIKFKVIINDDAPVGDIVNTATINSNSFIFPSDTFTASADATITLGDITPPNPPIIISPTEGENLNNNLPVVSGTAEPNSFITVTGPNGETCTTQANSAGGWSCQLSPALIDGSNTLSVTARDTAGNTSNPATVNVNIDTLAPAAPVCSVTPDPANDGTMVTATCTGVETGATVTVPGYVCTAEKDNVVTCTATVGVDGVDGDETATIEDAAGNTANAPVEFELDNDVPAMPMINDPSSGLTVSGTGEPGATVTVTTPSGATCTAEVQDDGSWSCDLSPEPVDGETASAIQEDLAGNESMPATATVAYAPDLSSFITNCVAGVRPDEDMLYEINIMNAGNIDIAGAAVTTLFSDRMSEPSWVCQATGGAICDNTTGNGDLNELVDLPAGSSLAYLIESQVTGVLFEFIDVETTVTMPAGTTDTNISNNTTFDSDLIYQFIFKDGFECALPGTIETTNLLLGSMPN